MLVSRLSTHYSISKFFSFLLLHCQFLSFCQFFLFLAGLATCDLLFCIVTISSTYLRKKGIIYDSMNIHLIVALYGPYLINLFIKVSTTLVVLLALYRHIAISYPIPAKQYLTARNTSVCVIMSFALWMAGLIPLTWSWTVEQVSCPEGDTAHHMLKQVC